MEPMIKRCRICGDQASGFNYSGLSCESCKVFFCRNSPNFEKLKCRKNGNCQIDKSTRRCCTYCRMIKCLENGMVRKKPNSPSSETTNTSSSEDYESELNPMQFGIDKVLELDILKNISMLEDISIDEGIVIPKSNKKRQVFDLNQVEVDEIAKIQKAFSEFGNEQTALVIREAKTVQECMFGPEIYIRRAINFCRQFEAFNSLNGQDQIMLLKLFSFDVLTLRFAFNYDTKTNSVLMFGDNDGKEALVINCDLGRDMIENQALIDLQLKLGIMLQESLENDSVIRDLFSAILLFRPRDAITCLESMRYHYFYYSRLLQRYLEHKHKSIQQANKKYSHIMAQTHTLDKIKQNKYHMMDECRKEGKMFDLPQIVQELYDLT